MPQEELSAVKMLYPVADPSPARVGNDQGQPADAPADDERLADEQRARADIAERSDQGVPPRRQPSQTEGRQHPKHRNRHAEDVDDKRDKIDGHERENRGHAQAFRRVELEAAGQGPREPEGHQREKDQLKDESRWHGCSDCGRLGFCRGYPETL